MNRPIHKGKKITFLNIGFLIFLLYLAQKIVLNIGMNSQIATKTVRLKVTIQEIIRS
jgi:hypothetical protein